MDQLRTDDPQAADFTRSDDPIALFAAWMKEAEAAEPEDPNAMALATAGSDGLPDVRVVLLKGFDARGVVWFTNYESRKGRELAIHPFAALHGDPHRLEHCVDRYLGLDLGNVGNARHLIDDVDLDHAYWLLGKCK